MDTNDTQIKAEIAKKYSELPQGVKDMIDSADFRNKVRTISNTNGLMIDQMGMLQSEVLFVMLGIEPSSDFVNNISGELDINKEKAEMIAHDINQQIFDPIRSYLREWEEQAEKQEQEDGDPNNPHQQTIGTSNGNFGSPNFSNASLEQAGGFKIEPSLAGTAAKADNSGVNATDRAGILDGIENPASARETSAAKEEAAHYEPLVDQLLNGPAAIPQEKIVRTAADMQAAESLTNAAQAEPSVPKPLAKPQPPVNLPTSDPYREPIK